jgi:hypothetical protein
MDTDLAQLLGPAIYNDNLSDIASKLELSRVVAEAGTNPEIGPVLLLTLITLAICTFCAVARWGFYLKIRDVITGMICIGLFILFVRPFEETELAMRTPENDLYAVTVVSEEKENVWLMDGLYELKEVKEEGSAYVVEIPSGEEKPQQVFLPKAQYHVEKVIDIETDTLTELQTALSEPEKS